MSHTVEATVPVGLLWGLRCAATVLALLLLAQGVTAGQYLTSNSPGSMDLHGAGAITIHVVAGLQTLLAALLWRASRGPWWPAVASAVVFGVSFVQADLGSGSSLDLHVPLGLALLLLASLVLAWSWSASSQTASRAQPTGTRPGASARGSAN